MMQIVDGLEVYVVEFDTMPELPITGMTKEEAQNAWYQNLIAQFTYRFPVLKRPTDTGDYARALTDAIETGVITKPGKYGIRIDQHTSTFDYSIYEFNE